MHSVDVLHEIAALLVALFVIRGIQAIGEHYFPGSDPVAVGRFLVGGPG